VKSDGNVGINSAGSNAKLEVVATSGEVFRADSAGGAYRIVANQTGVNMQGSVGITGSLGVTGNARLNSTSDGNDAFRFYRQDGTLTSALYTWGSMFNIESYSSQTINLSGGDVKVNTGNLVIGTAGKGIDFSAQTPTATGTTGDEVLDHYEEGTWTPQIVGYSGGTTQTYTTQSGKYTKIGDMVYATFYVELSSKGNISGNYTLLAGLPFNHNTANGGSITISGFANMNSGTTWVGGDLSSIASWVWLTKGTSGAYSSGNLNTSDISNTTRLVGTAIYRV
jgi:hypothetical protein